MSWKPSEGLKRAEAIVSALEAAQAACGGFGYFSPVLRHRATDIVAQALDQALTDGATQDALEAMTRAVEPHAAGLPNGGAGYTYQGVSVEFDPAPPTADPVGLDMPDSPAGPTIVVGDGKVVGPAGVTATIAEQLKHIDKTEPKKRGRPKGSTNKAKKKARAAKKAGTSLTDIPNAAPEAEPPAGEAA